MAQVALSLVLLVGAMLFVRSFQNLVATDPGFRPEGIVAVNLNLRRAEYTKERVPVIIRELERRLASQPSIRAVAQVMMLPVSGSGWDGRVRAEAPLVRATSRYSIAWDLATFQTMGTTLIAGREFDQRDTPNSPKVAIVNEEFAKRVFGAVNPVGRLFRMEVEAGKSDPVFEVVGVIRNTKYYELREDFRPIGFFPMAHEENAQTSVRFVMRTGSGVGDVMSSIKSAVAAVNPDIGLEFRVLTTQLQESLMRERLMATFRAHSVCWRVCSQQSVYGVIAYMVERRRNEIGVRMALGADRSRVVLLVVREAGVLLIVGLVVGTGLSIWAGKAAATLLFGLKPHDPLTLSAAIALLSGVAMLSTYAPARRASRVDPMVALREE